MLETLRTGADQGVAARRLRRGSPVDLLVSLQRELVTRTGADPGQIEDVIIGCASQNAEQGANIARTATMLADWGDVPASPSTGSAPRASTQSRRPRPGSGARTSSWSRPGAWRACPGADVLRRRPAVLRPGHGEQGRFGFHGHLRRPGGHHGGLPARRARRLRPGDQRKAARAWNEGFFDRSLVPLTRPDGWWSRGTSTCGRSTTLADAGRASPAFAQQGAEGQDALALAAHPEVDEIRHLHTVGTSPALADAAALVLVGRRTPRSGSGSRRGPGSSARRRRAPIR